MARPCPLIVLQVLVLVLVLVLALGVPAESTQISADTGTINIMQPERLAPVRKHKKPRGPSKSLAPAPAPQGQLAGTQQHKMRRGSANPVYPTPLPAPHDFTPPPPQQVVTSRPAAVPPPLYVPQTGQLLPNLPTVSGSGPGGGETSQDRAARCAHQAGVYGQAAGDRNAYIGSCINQ